MTLAPEHRRALAYCTFLAGCVLLAPRQWGAAGIAFSATTLLLTWHLLRTRGEAAREREAAAARKGASREEGASASSALASEAGGAEAAQAQPAMSAMSSSDTSKSA